MNRAIFRGLLAALTGALAAPAVFAAAFLPSEVLVGGRPFYPIEGGLAYIQAYNAAGIYQRDAAQLFNGHPRDALTFGNDVLFADVPGVVRMSPNGTLSLHALSDYITASLAIDALGNVFLGVFGVAQDGSTPVVKLDGSGHQIALYSVPSDRLGATSMDLAADQCTLFYACTGRHVKRYDTCQNKALPDVIDFGLGVFVRKIRILPDGSILATANSRIVRLSPSGATLEVYGAGASNLWISLSVTPDNRSFWAGSEGSGGGDQDQITEFDINTGAVLAGPIRTAIPSNPFFDLPPEFVLAVGEQRIAQIAPASIPTLSKVVELALVLLLVSIALMRLR